MSTLHRLRLLTTADVDAIHAIENAVAPYPWKHGMYLDSLASGHSCWGVVDDAAQLRGYILLMHAVDVMQILNLGVAPDSQRQGVGEHLLQQAAALSRDHHMRQLMLEVRRSNQAARHLYQKVGFVELGVRKGYYSQGPQGREDALVMGLDL